VDRRGSALGRGLHERPHEREFARFGRGPTVGRIGRLMATGPFFAEGSPTRTGRHRLLIRPARHAATRAVLAGPRP
jgi:hypothetical protein